MQQLFETLNQFINESNQSNSNNDKIEVIKRYSHNPELMQLIRLTYDPFTQLGVTSKGCQKKAQLVKSGYTNIFNLLNDLAEAKIRGDEAIGHVNGFVASYPDYQELIWRIIDRNLKTRATAETINKVVPGLIPQFKVALAKDYAEHKAKVDFSQATWFASPKLDGLRCLTIINEHGEIKFYSRKGKQFYTLDKVRQALKQYNLTNVVLDGEVCVIDDLGEADFTAIQSQIHQKNHTIEAPKLVIFDALSLDEFQEQIQSRTFSQRHKWLEQTFDGEIISYHAKPAKNGSDTESLIQVEGEGFNLKGNHVLKVLRQAPIKSEQEFNSLRQTMHEHSFEGLMLRKDTTYEAKRTDKLLKVKYFNEAEYTVRNIAFDRLRIINQGVEEVQEMLSHVTIWHKGYAVSVGSGFSIPTRQYYYQNPNELMGTQITVQYFDESQNKEGGLSLRFPTVKAIWPNGRDV